jgi:hypothetical protein
MSITKYLDHVTDKWKVRTSKVLEAVNYLKAFGYLNDSSILVESNDNTVEHAVRNFQRSIDITEDGEVGPQTLRAMQYPRCGCPDALALERAEQLRKWGKTHLTYHVERRDLNDLTAEEWDRTLAKALRFWSDITKLSFERVHSKNRANLNFSVGAGRSDNFDGPGRTLAWAYLPPSDSYHGRLEARFDKAERWIVDKGRGIRLLNVACHEIGHLLGLAHSEKKGALMAPYYNPSIEKPQIVDDVPRIVQLYGEPAPPKPPAPPTPKPAPKPTPEPPKPAETLTINIKGEVSHIDIPGYRVTPLRKS